MPATDLEQRVGEAIVTILDGHAGLQGVMGRATGLVVERFAFAPRATTADLPILVYDILSLDEGTNQFSVLFSGLAHEQQAKAKIRAMFEQAKLALTGLAFAAQGLDVVPLEGVRSAIDETTDLRGSFPEGTPLLMQEDWSLPLLYVE